MDLDDDQYGYSNDKLELDRDSYPNPDSYEVLKQQQQPISKRKKFGNCLLASCKFTIKAVMFLTFLFLFVGIIFWGISLTKDVNLHFELQRNLKIEMGGIHQQIKDVYGQLKTHDSQYQDIVVQLQRINDQLEALNSKSPLPPLSTSTSQGISLTEN